MRVYSQPGHNDGLIRYWLARQGWRVGHVKNGTVWVPTATHADYLTTLMARRWDEFCEQPQVGIYGDYEVSDDDLPDM